MTKGVDIIIGDITLKKQSSQSGSYGQDSLASGVYRAVELYDNDFTDVKTITPFQIGSNKVGVIILHD